MHSTFSKSVSTARIFRIMRTMRTARTIRTILAYLLHWQWSLLLLSRPEMIEAASRFVHSPSSLLLGQSLGLGLELELRLGSRSGSGLEIGSEFVLESATRFVHSPLSLLPPHPPSHCFLIASSSPFLIPLPHRFLIASSSLPPRFLIASRPLHLFRRPAGKRAGCISWSFPPPLCRWTISCVAHGPPIL